MAQFKVSSPARASSRRPLCCSTSGVLNPALRPLVFSRSESVSPARIEEHGFENTTIADVSTSKGKDVDGPWLWCTVEDSVYDVVQSMTQHNVGALVVVKPGQ
ncbi:CBS domain-containing protein CBSX3, mitochondrial [Linum grandiflorum]